MAPQFEEDVFVDVRRLGCGSYGEVWEVSATHLNGMRFARKRLPIRNASDARHTIAEIRLLYLCAHKNIIPLYDVYLTDRRSGHRVLAMSNHVDTTTRVPASLPPHARTPIEMRDATFLDRLLQVLLSVSPESTTVNLLFPLMDHDLSALIPVPSEAHAAVLAREILEGLIHLHHHGITHRDIKASNVFLCRCTGRVVLGDLGAAALSRTHQRHHTIIGSPHWMAPEVIAGAENGDLMRGVVSSVPCAIHSTSHMTDVSSGYSQSADVWSFGILMIELLTGSAPHRNVGTRDELFNAILNDPAPSLPQRAPATDGTPERGWVFTDKCRDFVARCTMKDSTRRPSATDLRNDPFLVEHAMIRVTDLYSFYDSPQHETTSSAVAPEPMQHVIQLSDQFTRTLTEVTCTEYLVLSKKPMGTGPTNTLVGQCNPGAASSIWDETTATLSTTTSTSTMRSSHPGTREEVAALFSEVLSLTHELQHTCPQLLCHWAYHILNTEPEVRAGLRPAVPSGHPDFWSDKPGVVEAREYFPTPTTRASPRPREQHSNTPIDDGNVDSTTRTNPYFLSGVELMPCALPPTQGQVHTQIASYLYSRWWDRVARQGRGTKNNT